MSILAGSFNWKTRGAHQNWNPHAYGTAKDPDGTNDGETVQVKAYSPHYDQYKTDLQNQFVLKLKPSLKKVAGR
jgi:hypothetical protein